MEPHPRTEMGKQGRENHTAAEGHPIPMDSHALRKTPTRIASREGTLDRLRRPYRDVVWFNSTHASRDSEATVSKSVSETIVRMDVIDIRQSRKRENSEWNLTLSM